MLSFRTGFSSAAIALLIVTTGAGAQSSSGITLGATMGLARNPRIADLTRAISPARIRETDSVLVSFGTRHTMSDTVSAVRGIGASRRFIHARLSEYSRDCGGCLRVEYDPTMTEIRGHPDRPMVNIVNVLAWLPGRNARRVVVMGAHYDTCVCNRRDLGTMARFESVSDAPGADDDGSGTAAVMELARVFSRHYPRGLDATIVFALYSGEEIGLLGSQNLARRLHAEGFEVASAFTDDMVGNVSAEDGRVDSTTVRIFGAEPDNGSSRELARHTWAVGTLYTPRLRILPVFRLDRISRGGDHSPFVALGDPGLRFSERLENYKRQHLAADVMAHVNFGYVANIARLNAATVASVGLAPRMPYPVLARRDQESGGVKWMVTWPAIPGAASYEVLFRYTTSVTWQKVYRVSGATSFLLPEQLDDGWVAVRAVGADGHRSLASSAPPPCPVLTTRADTLAAGDVIRNCIRPPAR